MLTKLAIHGYRSLREIKLQLGPLTLVTGPNGAGKSNLYKALRLLADVAQGRVIRSLAWEGGLSSTLWAGPETIAASVRRGEHSVQGLARKNPVSLKLGFAGDDYGYAIDLGLPPAVPPSAFSRDPEIKAEALWHGELLTKASIAAVRKGPLVQTKYDGKTLKSVMQHLSAIDSMMTHCADPAQGIDLLVLRERMRGWRFYDHFRSDRDAPARKPQVGTFTPVLADDGSDLASAIATIREIGNGEILNEAVEDAFPKSSVVIGANDGLFELEMRQHGMLRSLKSAELSDGTLRYLLWVAALLSPRPPTLMVLNEPETSLHTDLVEPLGRLILQAAKSTQLIVISHNQTLLETLLMAKDVKHVSLKKDFGETIATTGEDNEHVHWSWPER
jgi:predicted ATPase